MGSMPRTTLDREAYAFDACFGKQSVFILDPRLRFILFRDAMMDTHELLRYYKSQVKV